MKHTADIILDTQCLAVSKRGALGYIYNDSRKSFYDGSYILTSPVQNLDTYLQDGFIETRNTIYKIVK